MNGTAFSHRVLPQHLALKVTECLDAVRVAAPSEKLDAFKLCSRQVFALSEVEYPLQEKVDRLQSTAEAYGLTEQFGDDAEIGRAHV